VHPAVKDLGKKNHQKVTYKRSGGEKSQNKPAGGWSERSGEGESQKNGKGPYR